MVHRMEARNTPTIERCVAHHHWEMLTKESAVIPEVIEERGYFTANEAEELIELGFAENQARVPALVIPVWGVDGRFRFHRIRPDNPRPNPDKPGKVNKYEQPSGTPLVLDVPRRCQPYLADTNRPLWFVEGERKADSLATQGEVVVAILGVWAWKRYCQPLPDFDAIPMIGREISVLFDSDAEDNVNVRKGLLGLARYLKGRIGDA